MASVAVVNTVFIVVLSGCGIATHCVYTECVCSVW